MRGIPRHAKADDPGADYTDSNDAENAEENSDEEDIFRAGALQKTELSAEYKEGFLYRWHGAVEEVTAHLRDDALLPLRKAGGGSAVVDDVTSGVALPAWHCAFYADVAQKMPCNACAPTPLDGGNDNSTFEKGAWAHVRSAHRHVLRRIATDWKLVEAYRDKLEVRDEVHYVLWSAALAAKDRRRVEARESRRGNELEGSACEGGGTGCARARARVFPYRDALGGATELPISDAHLKERLSVPLLGHSTDRRSIKHAREVFREDNIRARMCFACACKEAQHKGANKFGHKVETDNMCYRADNEAAALRIIAGDKKGGVDPDAEEAWQFNMSEKRFKDRFGQAVSTDPNMKDSSTEWFREVRRRRGVDRVLCCPEDLYPSWECHHEKPPRARNVTYRSAILVSDWPRRSRRCLELWRTAASSSTLTRLLSTTR